MDRVELRHGGATDVGRVRDHNEDAWLARPPVFAVADGMGGHQAGDVASALAVEELARLAGSSWSSRQAVAEAVQDALEAAQRRLEEYAAAHGAGRRDWYSGTTVVAALLVDEPDGPGWLVVNLGDSRAYRVAAGVLDRVSVDHSVVQELLDAGAIAAEEVATHPERHVLTRALGGPEPPRPDYSWMPVADAPRLLLCSDGVTEMLSDAELAPLLASADPGEAARRVVEAAVAAGGVDNATAVVVDAC